jgi:hypothetical protein
LVSQSAKTSSTPPRRRQVLVVGDIRRADADALGELMGRHLDDVRLAVTMLDGLDKPPVTRLAYARAECRAGWCVRSHVL